MSAGPSSRGTRQARRLGLVAGVLLSFVAVPTQGHAASGPTVRITLTEMTPAVGRPGRTLHIRGKVMNTGDEALRGLDMAMRLSLTPLGSRSEMAAVAAGETTSRDGRSVADQAAPTSDLAPGDTQEFSIAYRLAKDPDLNEFGVYVLGVEATAKDSQGRGRVGIVRTFLPWVPRHPGFRPSGFTLFWPLIDVPRLLSDGTFANDGLAREMDVGGRLERLVDEGLRLREHLAVTWVVDPDLLRTAEVMANGYSVRAPDGSRVPGGAAAIASSWLAQVRSATAVGDVVALPYGDPDLDAVTHAGMDEDLVDARVLGTRVASEVLGRAVTSNVAWPAGGFTDRHTLAQLRAGGVDAALLNGRAMPPKLPLSYTPGGRATIHTASGTVAALLYDPGLSGLLARNTGSAVLNSQRFIAETALVTAELPSLGGTRKILVTPPRQWSPDGPEIDRLVTASPDASWLSTGSVGQLVRSRPPEVDRVALRYPREERRRQLPASYLSAVQALHDSVDNFAEVLTNPQTFVRGYDASVLRLEASWWRGKESRANRVDQERTRLAALRNRIQVLPGTYTFSSSSGSIPLTISNELSQQIVVDVSFKAETPRIAIGNKHHVSIGAHKKVQVEVPVRARARGTVQVDAQLRTPGPFGADFNQPVRLQVRVTEYGTVALLITFGAAGVLFLAAGIRLFRRAMAARRAAAPSAPEQAG